MTNSVNGTRDNTFAIHNPSQVNVTWTKNNVSVQLRGFAKEDDALQMEPDDPTLTYTNGLYGDTSANINMNLKGTVTLKVKGSSDSNKKFAQWHREVLSGNVVPATIMFTGIDFRDTALNCLPERMAVMPRSSGEDPAITWTFKASEVRIAEELTAA